LGSGNAIKMAGPGIMLSYIIGGAVIFMIMRALGEMAVHNPVAGSFSRYAQDYLGPLQGYLTGWNYWFLWLVTCVAEITAVAIYMGIWFPDVPRWIWAWRLGLHGRHQPAGRESLRRVRILVRPDQGSHHHPDDRRRHGHDRLRSG